MYDEVKEWKYPCTKRWGMDAGGFYNNAVISLFVPFALMIIHIIPDFRPFFCIAEKATSVKPTVIPIIAASLVSFIIGSYLAVLFAFLLEQQAL